MKKAALIIPTNKNNEALLQHKDGQAPHNPNTWCLFGGGVKAGESYEEAIRRELKEELSLSLGSVSFFKQFDDDKLQRRIFTTEVDKTAQQLLEHLSEGDNLGFFAWQEILGFTVAEPHRQILAEFFKAN